MNSAANEPHRPCAALPGKSVFFADVDVDRLVLEAARRADEEGLWTARRPGVFANKARVVFPEAVGVHHATGEPTSVVNVYRRKSNTIHGSPGSAHD